MPELPFTFDYIRLAGSLLLGLAGCHIAVQLLPAAAPLPRHWRLARTLAAGLVLGLVAWCVFITSLYGFFPYLSARVPVVPAVLSVVLCVAGAVGSATLTTYAVCGARNTLLAGSLQSSAASCALFVSMSGIAEPLVLAYNLAAVLAVMIGGTALLSLGLYSLKLAPNKQRRLLPATLMGGTLVLLNVGSLAAILPFSEWEAATATPNALALQPITVVFVSEFLAAMLLVRAGSSVDRRQAMRMTQENERLRQLTDCTFEGILVFRDGIILDANQALCRMVALDLEEMKGRHLTEVDGLRIFLGHNGTQPVECDLRDRSGLVIPVEMLSREIAFGDGVAYVTAVRDIRDRRLAEQSERDHQRVVDLQRETSELRERARLANEANRAKSTFLAMMSHEIRTPMNGVLGLAGALLNDNLSHSQQRVVSVIRESGEALLRILDDILDYSKLDAGRLTLDPIPFSPATLTHEAISIYGPKAVEKGLSISVIVDPGLPTTLQGDAGRIRQVLMNLVSNAVKFTEFGAVIIQARRVECSDDVVTVEWEVRDTGIGISTEEQTRLFGEFMQADDFITRRFGGTGLGLAISRRITEQMGGEMQAELQLGLGSVFRFKLALPQVSDATSCAPVQRDPVALLRAALLRLGRPAHLLVAEDNPTNQFVLEQLFKGFDVVLDVVGDGEAAVAAASSRTYDAVCMDMRMPKMDGLEATRIIRRLGGAAATMPVIALTANAFPSDVKACLEAGMEYFISKPIASNLLYQALERALSGSAQIIVPAPPDVADELPLEMDEDVLEVLTSALGRDTVGRMVEIFNAETEQRLARLADGTLGAADLRDEMHALKGTAATVGALRLSWLAAAEEMHLKRGLGRQLSALPDLENAFSRYMDGLARLKLVLPAEDRQPRAQAMLKSDPGPA